MKTRIRLIIVSFVIMLPGISVWMQAQQSTLLIMGADSTSWNGYQDPAHGNVIREKSVVLSPSALSQDRLELNLFSDTQFRARMQHVDQHKSGATVSWGRLDNEQFGYVLIANYGDTRWIKIESDDGRLFVIESKGHKGQRAGYVLKQIDAAQAPEEECSVQNPNPSQPPSSSSHARNTGSVCDVSSTCSPQVVDIMVAYTTTAKDIMGGTSNAQAEIAAAVSEMNIINGNSGLQHTYNLVHTVEVAYNETGNASTDLQRLYNRSDGHLDDLHDLRDLYHADLVSMVVSYGCGIGYVNNNPDAYSDRYAFSLASVNCMTTNKTLAHEAGHNMGLLHDHHVSTSGTSAACDWGHGYVNPGAQSGAPAELWRTVLAYNSQCASWGYNCTRVAVWSTPHTTVNGDPAGTSLAAAEPAYAAYLLDRSICKVAAFRDPPCLTGGYTQQHQGSELGVLHTGTYNYGTYINLADYQVPVGNQVTITAETSVGLMPTFSVEAGATFEMDIQDCPE